MNCRRWIILIVVVNAFTLVNLNAQLVNSRQYDEQMEALAKIVAVQAGQNMPFRAFIKQKALERFDGDYNFLINPVLYYQLSDGTRIVDLITALSNDPESLVSFIQSQTRLQIAVPVHCETWELTYSPSVIAIPQNYEEHLSTQVRAFDQNGRTIFIPTNSEPEVPFIVLSLNERTDASGQLLDAVVLGAGGPIDDDDDDDGGDGGGSGPTNGGSTNCYGDDGAWQYLKLVKVTNLNAIEHWINGAPEIRFIFKRTDDAGLVNGEIGVILVPESREAIDNSWVYFNATLFRWYNETQGFPQVGSSCIANITEKDNGNWFTLPISVTAQTAGGGSIGLNLTITITDKDELVGTIPTYFEDCNLHIYNPGSLSYILHR